MSNQNGVVYFTIAHAVAKGAHVGPDRLLRPLDQLIQRLDRLSGLRARRQRRWAEAAGRTRFAYELGRWVGPVADRCGYGDAQISGISAIFCGDPAEVFTRHPWAVENPDTADQPSDPRHCVDLQVGWRDGWVELRAEPFVRHALLAPAEGRRALGPALRDVAHQLEAVLDHQAITEGTSPWDDPRPSDGSWGYLRG